MGVVNHYNDLVATEENPQLDSRLIYPENDLNFTQQEKEALVAFLETLTGNNVYTAEQWSDPFDENGELIVMPLLSGTEDVSNIAKFKLFPNPTSDIFYLNLQVDSFQLIIFDMNGKLVRNSNVKANHQEDVSDLRNGIYFVQIKNLNTNESYYQKLVKI